MRPLNIKITIVNGMSYLRQSFVVKCVSYQIIILICPNLPVTVKNKTRAPVWVIKCHWCLLRRFILFSFYCHQYWYSYRKVKINLLTFVSLMIVKKRIFLGFLQLQQLSGLSAGSLCVALHGCSKQGYCS